MPIYPEFIRKAGFRSRRYCVRWYKRTRVTNRRGKKISPVLDKQYGQKIKENLNALEDAVRKDNIPAARIRIQERDALLDEIRKLSNSYVSANWTNQCFAADEVKKYIAAGSALEDYVNAR